jgi:hypothetical protein
MIRSAPGSHVVRAQKKGYLDVQRTVQVPWAGAQLAVRLEAERRFGTLDIFTEPWGEIFIDGKDTAKQTPQRGLRVPAGRHKVRIVNPKLETFKEFKVDVKPDGRELLRGTLERGP